ncbi:MAG: hypothetical protein WA324_08960 [Bryobacteraceae bacterium]
MAVRAVYLDQAHAVRAVRYAWAEDGTLLLTLDCYPRFATPETITFSQLAAHLQTLCAWQRRSSVFLGFKDSLVELLTLYHEFEISPRNEHTLMLVCTPPDEYFEAVA